MCELTLFPDTLKGPLPTRGTFTHSRSVLVADVCLYTHTCLCENGRLNKFQAEASRGGKGGHNSSDAESLQVAPNDCGGRRNVLKCHKYFLQNSTFTSEQHQFQTWGCQTCFSPRASSNLVTPLGPGRAKR